MMERGQDRASRFFEGFAREFDSFYDGQRGPLMRALDATFRPDMFIRFALTFHAFWDLRERTVLDVGCGSGVYALEALRRGAARVTLVDGARSMLDLARNRMRAAGLEERAVFVEATWPTVVGPHDYAIVMGVLDYVSDPAAFLATLRASVRGAAAISFPSRHWLRSPIRRMRYRARGVALTFYDGSAVERLCRQAGFSEIRIYKVPGAGQDFHVVAAV